MENDAYRFDLQIKTEVRDVKLLAKMEGEINLEFS